MKISGVGMFRFLFIGSLTMNFSLAAQQKEVSSVQDTSFVINTGIKLNDVIPVKYLFHCPEFLNGKVFFKDGNVRDVKMNYSRLMDEMLFINNNEDTLAIDNEPTIKLICINKDSFYFDRGYILLIKSSNTVKLGVKHGFRLGDKRKPTGYDMMSSTSSVSSFSSIHDGNKLYELEVKEQVRLHTVTQFYFGDKYNHFIYATEKNLLDMFPKCSGLLKAFSKKNSIDFSKRKDLEKLVFFINHTCL